MEAVLIGILTAIATIVAGLIAITGILWQSKAKREDDKVLLEAKRNDDKLQIQLQRLDKQLNNLYGPLYALYESGDRQWRSFLKKYSNYPGAKSKDPDFLGYFPDDKHDFTPPQGEGLRVFRLWMENVFMVTNMKMEDAMTNSAGLLIGEEMPECFLNFRVHMASTRAAMEDQKSPGFDPNDWERHIAIFPHPAGELHRYIKAAFEILKKEQSLLLSRKNVSINEGEIDVKIKKRIEELKKS